MKIIKLEKVEQKRGKEVVKEWQVQTEKAVVYSEEIEVGEEEFRNSYWIKDLRLILFTSERIISFDEDLNELSSSMISLFNQDITFLETCSKGYKGKSYIISF